MLLVRLLGRCSEANDRSKDVRLALGDTCVSLASLLLPLVFIKYVFKVCVIEGGSRVAKKIIECGGSLVSDDQSAPSLFIIVCVPPPLYDQRGSFTTCGGTVVSGDSSTRMPTWSCLR